MRGREHRVGRVMQVSLGQPFSPANLAVVLVTPSGLLGELIERALRRERRIALVAVLSPSRAIELSDLPADVVLLDVTDTNAAVLLDTVSELPTHRYLALVNSSDKATIQRAASAGIVAFAAAESSYRDLVNGLLGAAGGRVICPEAIAATLLEAARSDVNAHARTALTTREHEVMELVAQGMANKQIAARLDVSISTVKSHVHLILGKLEARTRTEAAAKFRIGARSISADETDD